MSETFSARRRGDGSIDFDFYRAQAAALRGQTIRDAVTLKRAGIGIAILVALPLVLAGTAAAFNHINPQPVAIAAICTTGATP